jgi:hypothetical protein
MRKKIYRRGAQRHRGHREERERKRARQGKKEGEERADG